MNTDAEISAESWKRLESALGGRFRDGVECPPIVRIFRAAIHKAQGTPGDDSMTALREHLEVCPVCRQTWRAADMAARDHEDLRSPRDQLEAAITKTHGQTQPLDPDQSLADELAELVTRPHETEDMAPGPVTSPVVPDLVVAAGAGDAGAFVFRGVATTRRRGEDCIVVGFGDDERAVRLRRRVAEHAFGDVWRSFELRVLRVPVAGRGDVYQAQLEMEPAPTQNDLEIIVQFREGGERRFRLEVPPGLRRDPASVPRPRTRSALSDPLPAAAFNLHGGSEWVDDAWPATLILRSHGAAARAERFPGWTCGASGPASLSAANADCVMHTASLYALAFAFAETRHESATD